MNSAFVIDLKQVEKKQQLELSKHHWLVARERERDDQGGMHTIVIPTAKIFREMQWQKFLPSTAGRFEG